MPCCELSFATAALEFRADVILGLVQDPQRRPCGKKSMTIAQCPPDQAPCTPSWSLHSACSLKAGGSSGAAELQCGRRVSIFPLRAAEEREEPCNSRRCCGFPVSAHSSCSATSGKSGGCLACSLLSALQQASLAICQSPPLSNACKHVHSSSYRNCTV